MMHYVEEAALQNITLRQQLTRQLSKLPNDYTRVIVILCALGWKQYEIAEVVGCQKQSISWIVQQAIKKLEGPDIPAKKAGCLECGIEAKKYRRGLCSACYKRVRANE